MSGESGSALLRVRVEAHGTDGKAAVTTELELEVTQEDSEVNALLPTPVRNC